MKINKLLYSILIGSALAVGCSDFEEINVDPNATNIEQLKPEFFLNQSITGAQQNPHISERMFSLTWMDVSRMADPMFLGGHTEGGYSDGWLGDYYKDYISQWITAVNSAIVSSDYMAENATDPRIKANAPTIKGIAKIWRVYLVSEFVDNFGTSPIYDDKGAASKYKDVFEVYDYFFKELREAESLIDESANFIDSEKVFDRAYGFDASKWMKYCNSMRMRLAMRLSEVKPEIAKKEFEDAVKTGKYIASNADNFTVKEKGGWNELAGVLTREWSIFNVSATLNNLLVGLGGVSTTTQINDDFTWLDSKPDVKAAMLAQVKDEDYAGLMYNEHFTTKTDEPNAGLFFDGLRNKIDPRAYKLFSVPGDYDDPNYCKYPSWNANYTITKRPMYKAELKGTEIDKEDKTNVLDTLDGKFKWNAYAPGEWGDLFTINRFRGWPWAQPILKNNFRNSENSRVFFGAWETHFLIAEAALRGWSVGKSAKDAYESGIKESFDYFGVSKYLSAYLQSEEYNNIGTSVKWDHTAEASTKTMKVKNAYTKADGTIQYKYPDPKTSLYGKSYNGQLAKIITQKYIANTPWLALEGWSDYRRLGLPFMETPAVEKPIITMPELKESSYHKQQVSFYPQRLKFPSVFKDVNDVGYGIALEKLGGKDEVLQPIKWAKQK